MPVAVQIETTAGQWRTMDAHREVTHVEGPPRMRRAAVEELERHGIRWLAIHDLDPGSRDLLMRQEQWGIEEAGASGRYRLYRLQ